MDGTANPRRRRGAGIVTPTACKECRKKRSKCDGRTPCQRCVTQNTPCVYETPVRHSKDMMRSEIDQLQIHRRQSERVLNAIASTSVSQETVNRLKNGQSLEQVADWLDHSALQGISGEKAITTFHSSTNEAAIKGILETAERGTNPNYTGFGGIISTPSEDSSAVPSTWSASHTLTVSYSMDPVASQGEDAMNWIRDESERSGPSALSSPLIGFWPRDPDDNILGGPMRAARIRGQDQILGPSYEEHETSHNPHKATQSWTTITHSAELVEHLMALYFCWEYPTFASLSKEHFLTDFRAGRPRYCSSILVNAMLALGCRFSSLPETRADPDDPETSGDHFFAEAKKLLLEDDYTSLTTVQALGLIAIREASCGRDTESFFYGGQAVRLAVEFGLHTEVTEKSRDSITMDHDVRAATFWGAFALDQALCLSVGKIPHFSRSVKLVSKPAIMEEVELSEWVPYTDDGVPETKYASQPSNVRSVYKAFCEVSELVHQTLYTLYAAGQSLTSNEILAVYTRYLNWYSSLPEALRLGHNFTPAVLFAHMFYHFSILMLFRPFIKLRFVGSATSPSDVCSQAADAITTLVRSYDQLYTLQRTPSFVPYIVLAASIMHLVVGKESGDARQLQQGAADLHDMCRCHGFSKRGIDILRFLGHHWDLENILGEQDPPSAEMLANMCTPLTTSLNLFCPNMGTMLPDMEPRGETPIFSPFPMQGRPLLAFGEQLKRDGFIRSP